MSRDCVNGDASGGGTRACFECWEEGHMSRNCTNPASQTMDHTRKVPMYIPPPPPEGEAEIFETIAKGINFSRYDEISVEVTGNGTPAKGIVSFEDGDMIHEVFVANVRKARYDKPTPIQKWAIPVIASGRDLMACVQTGSGKTAAFLLPVLSGMKKEGITGSAFSDIQEPQALVVGPTRERVVKIYDVASQFSYGTMIRPVVLYGGVSVNHQLSQVAEGAHIVVGTPGRLLDLIRRKKISLEKVRYFILDEADRMLDLGFKNEMVELSRAFDMPADRQTLLFSATIPEEIQNLAKEFLRDYIFITIGRVGGANWDMKRDKLLVEAQRLTVVRKDHEKAQEANQRMLEMNDQMAEEALKKNAEKIYVMQENKTHHIDPSDAEGMSGQVPWFITASEDDPPVVADAQNVGNENSVDEGQDNNNEGNDEDNKEANNEANNEGNNEGNNEANNEANNQAPKVETEKEKLDRRMGETLRINDSLYDDKHLEMSEVLKTKNCVHVMFVGTQAVGIQVRDYYADAIQNDRVVGHQFSCKTFAPHSMKSLVDQMIANQPSLIVLLYLDEASDDRFDAIEEKLDLIDRNMHAVTVIATAEDPRNIRDAIKRRFRQMPSPVDYQLIRNQPAIPGAQRMIPGPNVNNPANFPAP